MVLDEKFFLVAGCVYLYAKNILGSKRLMRSYDQHMYHFLLYDVNSGT